MASSFAQSLVKLKLDYKTDKISGREMREIKWEVKVTLGKSGDVTFRKSQRYTSQQKKISLPDIWDISRNMEFCSWIKVFF